MERARLMCCLVAMVSWVLASEPMKPAPTNDGATWTQWRGPNRDSIVTGTPTWPSKLDEATLKERYRIKFGPSYSGPIVTDTTVFVTETKDRKNEVVSALDRQTGKQIWQQSWPGAMSVPFFAASNGDWIRSTPVYDAGTLYVAGMRDVLVALDAQTGAIKWKRDFVAEEKTPLPAFGFVCSPMIDGDFLYVQAAASFLKLDKKTGKTIWKTMSDAGGMNGSAFSSPVIAELAGKRQLLVQGREKLAGVDPETGKVLWDREVPHFRGMNILTPTVLGNQIFTSSYSRKSFMFELTKQGEQLALRDVWTNPQSGYMSSPVLIDGHIYIHLQNQRFACIDAKSGKTTWTTKSFGKYWSMVAQGSQILALDERGELLLIRANPKQFELVSSRKVCSDSAWAHLAVAGQQVFIRSLNSLIAFDWK